MTAPSAPGRSVVVDMLRGVAVTMVMCAHLPFSMTGFGTVRTTESYPPAWIEAVMHHGHYGVQLFLVISGYCIHTRWARAGDPAARIAFLPFWRRRLTRLYPPYVFVLGIAVGLAVLADRFFPGSVPPVSAGQLLLDLVVLLLLFQNLTDASSRVGNGPFWSLALEEQLYLLYFPLLAMRRASGWRLALGVSVTVTLLWLSLGGFVPPSWQAGYFRAGPAYWFAWALGAVAAESHVGMVKLPAWCESFWTFLVAVIAAALVRPPFQALFLTITFFFLLSACIAMERNGWTAPAWLAPFVRMGTISYGVYLIHNIAFIVSKRILIALHLPAFPVLVLRAAAGVVAGYGIYRLVERPFLERSQRIPVPLRRGAAALSPGVAAPDTPGTTAS